MGYIQDLERDLRKLLQGIEKNKQDEIVRFVAEKVLESYKNGLKGVKSAKQSKKFGKGK